MKYSIDLPFRVLKSVDDSFVSGWTRWSRRNRISVQSPNARYGSNWYARTGRLLSLGPLPSSAIAGPSSSSKNKSKLQYKSSDSEPPLTSPTQHSDSAMFPCVSRLWLLPPDTSQCSARPLLADNWVTNNYSFRWQLSNFVFAIWHTFIHGSLLIYTWYALSNVYVEV